MLNLSDVASQLNLIQKFRFMLVRFSDRNEYGYHTWRIMFNKAFQILIIQLNARDYSVELKEANWIRYKKIYSYQTTSSIGFGGLESVVINSIERVYEYFKQYRNDFSLSYEEMEMIKDDLMMELDMYRNN